MFKNIHVNLINAAIGCEILFQKTFLITYDEEFTYEIDIPCSLCEALEPACYAMSEHNFHSAVITDSTTGEVLAELKRVDEYM